MVDVLRLARVAVAHSLSRDKLQSQLGTAENMKVPFVLIIGQKEALDDPVIFREMQTGVQETIPLEKVIDEAKKRLKKISPRIPSQAGENLTDEEK